MAEVSNNALALLLVVAIVASVSSVVFMVQSPGGLTGFATSDVGETNFSIDQTVSIRFINNLVPFGTGRVNSSQATRCYMGTNNSPPNLAIASGCIDFNLTVHTQNLTIENDGNVVANVSLNFTRNATTFIGGTADTPLFKYAVNNSEAASCAQFQNGTGFTEVAANETGVGGVRICSGLDTDAASDLIQVGFWIQIPEDAAGGAHSVTVTAIGCSDGSC